MQKQRFQLFVMVRLLIFNHLQNITALILATIFSICYIIKKEAKTTATRLDNFYQAVTIASSGG